MAVETGQDLKRIGFKDQSWIGLKTRSRKFRDETNERKDQLGLIVVLFCFIRFLLNRRRNPFAP